LDQAVYAVARSLLEEFWQQLAVMALHHEQGWCLEQKLLLVEQFVQVIHFQSVVTPLPPDFWLQHSTAKEQVHYLMVLLVKLKVLPVKLWKHFFCQDAPFLRLALHREYQEVERQLDGASSEDFPRLSLCSLQRQHLKAFRSGIHQLRQVEADSDALFSPG